MFSGFVESWKTGFYSKNRGEEGALGVEASGIDNRELLITLPVC